MPLLKLSSIKNDTSSMKTNNFIDHVATVAGTLKMMTLRCECNAKGFFNIIEAKTSSKNRNFRKKSFLIFFAYDVIVTHSESNDSRSSSVSPKLQDESSFMIKLKF